MPVFSVIIPTFNSTRFIRRTVSSVQNQTFSDFELILVDDGSQDDTVHIIKKLEKEDSRIKVIITPNSGGPAVPTNIGLNIARGTYITFLDHDDEWKPHKLKTLHEVFTKHPSVGFICSNVEIFNTKKNTLIEAKAPIVNNRLSEYDILAGNYFNTFSMLAIRKTILQRIGTLDANLFVFADYDMIVRMISHNIEHIFLPDRLIRYYVHGENASSITFSAKRRIQDLERITTKYQKRFLMNPKSLSRVMHAIGRIHLNMGNRAEAVLYFKKSLTYNKSIASYVRFVSANLGEYPYRIMRKMKIELLRKVS